MQSVDHHAAPAGRHWRHSPAGRLLPVAAGAAVGLTVSVLFSDTLSAALDHLWWNVVMPAFLNLHLSGLPLCG